MFTKLKNIDTAFRQVRLFTILIIICSTAICGITIVRYTALSERTQSRIYILSDGKALEALAADRKDNVSVEARDHVRTFHRLFFTLDPDEKVLRANMSKALYLADGSARQAYDDLTESGYYAGIISANISQRINVDSVNVDMAVYPYHFRCYATQTITRATSTVTRRLVTEGWLRNVSRSDNNPHGFLIEHWTTIDNSDLKIINH